MRKSFVVLLLAMSFMTFLTSTGRSQDTYFPGFLEFNPIGGGARAAGMGGAFLGLSEGEMAYSWNPAGMIFAEKPTLGLQFRSVSDEFTTLDAIESDSLNLIQVVPVNVNSDRFNLSNGGFLIPFEFVGRSWAVGGGYRNIHNLNMEFSGPGFLNSTNEFSQNNGLDAISLSIATPITPNLGIGVTCNNYVRYSEANQFLGNYQVVYYQGNPDPDTVDTWINYNNHFTGINFDIGLMGQFGMFKGGAVIRTPYDLKQKSKLTYTLMTLPRPSGPIFRATKTTSIPLSFALGISVVPFEKITLAADYDSKPMGDAELDIDWESLYMADTSFNLNWEDVNQIRVGAEYMLGAGSFDVPLRLGYRNNPSVEKELLKDNLGQRSFGDQINTNIFSFGTGLHFERAWIDMAYQFGSSSYTSKINYGTEKTFEIKRDYSRLFVSAGMYF